MYCNIGVDADGRFNQRCAAVALGLFISNREMLKYETKDHVSKR